MKPHLKIRPASCAASQQRRMNPQHYLRLLEGHLSALIDTKDVPGWTVNPAYHPDVMEFIQTYSSNAAFLKKAQALQKNRAAYYARMSNRGAGRTTLLTQSRATTVEAPVARIVPEAILFATPLE